VDWIDDPKFDRGRVTSATAADLRERMRACSSLLYAHSSNSPKSKWMPWELGFFDGFKPGHVWILPLVANSDSDFEDQVYRGLYPPVEKLASLYGRQNLGFGRVGLAPMKRCRSLRQREATAFRTPASAVSLGTPAPPTGLVFHIPSHKLVPEEQAVPLVSVLRHQFCRIGL
jgi:hypothetical protein